MTRKEFFLQAADELARGEIDTALWAKASASALGDSMRTPSVFIQLRAQELDRSAQLGRIDDVRKSALGIVGGVGAVVRANTRALVIVCVVVFLGGIASLLYTQHFEERDRLEAERRQESDRAAVQQVLAQPSWEDIEASERLAGIKRQAGLIKAGKLRALAGLTLGQSRQEAMYVLGTPSSEAGRLMRWADDYTEKAAVLSKQGRVQTIRCGGANPSLPLAGTCDGDLAELSIGSLEQQVLERLGPPVRGEAFSGAEKTISYGTPSNGLDVVLAKGKVVRLVIYSGSNPG